MTMLASVSVPSMAVGGGKPGQCYFNVMEMISRHGGEPVFGWALCESGPSHTKNAYPPPLYQRWVNHVVWRDAAGLLWDVSPKVAAENPDHLFFSPTDFLIDPSANFEHASAKERPRIHFRFVPVRHEGEEVTQFLTLAQSAKTQDEMLKWIQKAIRSVAMSGFQPRKAVIQSVNGETRNIWIYAD